MIVAGDAIRVAESFGSARAHLDELLQAYTLHESPNGGTVLSGTIRSLKLAGLKYSPGELVTKADSALILGCSIRGVEYLMVTRKLRPIKFRRTTVFKRKKVFALRRRRLRYGRRTG